MTNERRCNQTKCGYYLQGGCQSCDDCNAKPFIINTNCDRCLSCEGEADVLRFGQKKQAQAIKDMIKIKLEQSIEAAESRIKSESSIEDKPPKEKLVIIER